MVKTISQVTWSWHQATSSHYIPPDMTTPCDKRRRQWRCWWLWWFRRWWIRRNSVKSYHNGRRSLNLKGHFLICDCDRTYQCILLIMVKGMVYCWVKKDIDLSTNDNIPGIRSSPEFLPGIDLGTGFVSVFRGNLWLFPSRSVSASEAICDFFLSSSCCLLSHWSK